MPMVEGMQMRDDAHAGQESMSVTMDMAADIELRVVPEPFDVAFVDAMIPHQQDVVDAARAALQRAIRSEIKTLARAIIDAKLQEIGMMQQWPDVGEWQRRRRWHPCRTADSHGTRPRGVVGQRVEAHQGAIVEWTGVIR